MHLVDHSDNDTITAAAAGQTFDSTERLTVSNAVKPLTPDQYAGRNYAFITVEIAALRYNVTGGNPTATAGHIANVGDVIELENEDEVKRFRAFRRDASDATIEVSYGRSG